MFGPLLKFRFPLLRYVKPRMHRKDDNLEIDPNRAIGTSPNNFGTPLSSVRTHCRLSLVLGNL
jgi:hypothetical protein